MKKQLIGGLFDGRKIDTALPRLTLVQSPAGKDPAARATYHDYAERPGDPAKMDCVSGAQTAALGNEKEHQRARAVYQDACIMGQ